VGFSDGAGEGGASKEDTIGPFVDAFVDFRETIRNAVKSKAAPGEVMQHCDDVRDTKLAALGIRVEDGAGSSVWKMDDPEVIRKEVEEKRQKAAEAAAKKIKAKLDKLNTDLTKAQTSKIPPAEFFKTGANAEKWGSYDDKGMPATTKQGEPLSKSQQKSAAKELKNHQKAHDKLVSAAGEQGIEAYLASLQQQIDELQANMDA